MAPVTFAYFSYITMATVGYGDLTPATGLPRTNAVLEALIGQIFLVVLVARLVGMYTPSFRWGHELHGEAAGLPLGAGGAGGAGEAGGGEAVRLARLVEPGPASRVGSERSSGQTMRTTGTIIGRRLVRSPTNFPNALRV